MQMHKKVADYVKQAKFEPKVQIEIGLTLKMLRKAMGLSAAKVSAANPDHLTARQIEKIEAGTHRPSGRNYEMLMQFYHKTGLEGQLLLETDSLEVLHHRQEIVDFIIREEWDNAWESFQSFKEKLDVNVPLNRQEVLFMESDILYKRKGHYDWLMQMRSGRFRYCMAKIVSAVIGGVVLYLISVLLFFALCLILVSGVRSGSTVESITHLFVSTECYWYRVVSAIGYYPMVILFAFQYFLQF